MPYRITWTPNYVAFDYHGEVTSADIIESNKEVYGDERFDQLHWELVSFDETQSVAFKTRDVRLIAYMDQAAARSNPRVTVAFIGDTTILEEVERAYENADLQTTWHVMRFDSRDEAKAYITQQN